MLPSGAEWHRPVPLGGRRAGAATGQSAAVDDAPVLPVRAPRAQAGAPRRRRGLRRRRGGPTTWSTTSTNRSTSPSFLTAESARRNGAHDALAGRGCGDADLRGGVRVPAGAAAANQLGRPLNHPTPTPAEPARRAERPARARRHLAPRGRGEGDGRRDARVVCGDGEPWRGEPGAELALAHPTHPGTPPPRRPPAPHVRAGRRPCCASSTSRTRRPARGDQPAGGGAARGGRAARALSRSASPRAASETPHSSIAHALSGCASHPSPSPHPRPHPHPHPHPHCQPHPRPHPRPSPSPSPSPRTFASPYTLALTLHPRARRLSPWQPSPFARHRTQWHRPARRRLVRAHPPPPIRATRTSTAPPPAPHRTSTRTSTRTSARTSARTSTRTPSHADAAHDAPTPTPKPAHAALAPSEPPRLRRPTSHTHAPAAAAGAAARAASAPARASAASA